MNRPGNTGLRQLFAIEYPSGQRHGVGPWSSNPTEAICGWPGVADGTRTRDVNIDWCWHRLWIRRWGVARGEGLLHRADDTVLVSTQSIVGVCTLAGSVVADISKCNDVT